MKQRVLAALALVLAAALCGCSLLVPAPQPVQSTSPGSGKVWSISANDTRIARLQYGEVEWLFFVTLEASFLKLGGEGPAGVYSGSLMLGVEAEPSFRTSVLELPGEGQAPFQGWMLSAAIELEVREDAQPRVLVDAATLWDDAAAALLARPYGEEGLAGGAQEIDDFGRALVPQEVPTDVLCASVPLQVQWAQGEGAYGNDAFFQLVAGIYAAALSHQAGQSAEDVDGTGTEGEDANGQAQAPGATSSTAPAQSGEDMADGEEETQQWAAPPVLEENWPALPWPGVVPAASPIAASAASASASATALPAGQSTFAPVLQVALLPDGSALLWLAGLPPLQAARPFEGGYDVGGVMGASPMTLPESGQPPGPVQNKALEELVALGLPAPPAGRVQGPKRQDGFAEFTIEELGYRQTVAYARRIKLAGYTTVLNEIEYPILELYGLVAQNSDGRQVFLQYKAGQTSLTVL